ncbi:hypothetical protein TNCV_528511 [Trichonephila clavipes]|nr:hypothetical protein TNCV_528511 [Trichonephila clavipes]
MDPIDAFPEHISTTVVPVTLPEKPDALEYAARQVQVRAGIIYQEPNAKRVCPVLADSRVTCAHSIVTSTCADSTVTCPRTCVDSRCSRTTCTDSRTTCLRTTWADSRTTWADSSLSQSLCRFQNHLGRFLPYPRACADSRTYADSRACADSPELDTLDPTDATSLDQLMSFVFGPPAQELHLLHTVPSIFHGDLISFLDEFERDLVPMDLTMPRMNPCVKKNLLDLKPSNLWICPVNK